MKRLDVSVPNRGDLARVADDVYWARFALPFRLNHINIYILDCGDSWLIMDSGINSEETAAHWQMLLSGVLSYKPVSQIIITHHHVDHIGYAAPLAALTGAKIYTSKGECEQAHWHYDLKPDKFGQIMASTYKRYGLSQQIIDEVRDNGSRYRRNCAPLSSFSMLENGHQIKTKSGIWDLRIDTGHSDAHISLMDKDRNLFLSVDFLLPRISPNISADIRNPDRDLLVSYFLYLEEMKELPEEMAIFPGHDWPFSAGGERAQMLIDHHHYRLDQLTTAAKQSPLTVATSMDILFGRMFDDHELYFASGEARAHLNYLVAHNRLSVEQTDKGCDVYQIK